MNPLELGLDPVRLDRLTDVIRADIAAERYDGCEIVVGRAGTVAYQQHFGFADRAAGRQVTRAQPFITMSVAKQFTVALVLRAIERGHFALSTPVAEVIPEFGVRGKGRVTVAHLLTHTGGLPAMLPPMPQELAGNLATVVEATSACLLESRPGTKVLYSVLVAHAILAEMVRRCEGGSRTYRQVLREELFEPLGMKDTYLGLPPAVAERVAPVVCRDRRAGLFEPMFLEAMSMLINEETEIPAGGAVSTAPDVHRFAEMLRAGGVIDGVRILSPATVEMLCINQTGDEPNSLFAYMEDMRSWDPFPANLGLGFFLRGDGIHPTPFGLLASPSTFGGFGAGCSVFWVDPERDLTYAFLSSGLMEESYSMERHQKLSDIVHSAVIA
jgi:CubicO group peptidase (beta-lactamase class C family)